MENYRVRVLPLLSPTFYPAKEKKKFGGPRLAVLFLPWLSSTLSFQPSLKLGSWGEGRPAPGPSRLLPKPPARELLRDKYC